MKAINILILSLVLAFSSCDNQGETEVYDYVCDLPAEIPKNFKNGRPVEWNCIWNDYYKDGKVQVILDDEGDLIALVRKVTGDWTPPGEETQVEFK